MAMAVVTVSRGKDGVIRRKVRKARPQVTTESVTLV
jgi:hypothetical protein